MCNVSIQGKPWKMKCGGGVCRLHSLRGQTLGREQEREHNIGIRHEGNGTDCQEAPLAGGSKGL